MTAKHTVERPLTFKIDFAELRAGFGGVYLVNAIVGMLFAASAPVAIILTAGQAGQLSEAEIASWIFGSFFLNGLISLFFCLTYRQPLVFFWTIPGTVLVGAALAHLSFAEVIGAYYATGLLMLILGIFGWMRKIMALLPMPIVMAMVAGVFLQFGLNLITALHDGLAIAGPMTIVFVLLSAIPALGKRLPPLIGALIVGAVIAVLLASGQSPGLPTSALGSAPSAIFAAPILQTPAFSWAAMIELVVPLAITVLAAQNAQGFAVLEAVGHKPPVNAITVACGIGSIVVATVGTVSSCLTGPTNAILASGGEREKHYTAGVMVALLALLFGLFAPLFTRMMLATPGAFIATLAGLALLPVIERAFKTSFQGGFTLSALVTFLVTVSGISVFSIGAPFWGLVAGYGVAWLLERNDFNQTKSAS